MEFNYNVPLSDCFKKKSSFDCHYKALKHSKTKYMAIFALNIKMSIKIRKSTKVHALAASLSIKDWDVVNHFLSLKKIFNISIVSEAVSLLDKGRKIRELERKLKRLQVLRNSPRVRKGQENPPRKYKMHKLKLEIDSLFLLKPSHGSLSGAICKRLRKWSRNLELSDVINSIDSESIQHWSDLADLVHFSPTADFPYAPWFLHYCFKNTVTEDCAFHLEEDLNADNVNSIIMKKIIPLSLIRPHLSTLTDESKLKFTKEVDRVDCVLAHYESLKTQQVDEEINRRLVAGERINLNYGVVLDLLIHMNLNRNPPIFHKFLLDHAEERFTNMKIDFNCPVKVFLDVSSSMQPVMHIASVITGLICRLTNTNLITLNASPQAATTTSSHSDINSLIQSACFAKHDLESHPLQQMCRLKNVCKTIVLITDENEDPFSMVMSFAELFYQYVNDVSAAELIIVSFLDDDHSTGGGMLVNKLNRLNITPRYFKLQKANPNLTLVEPILQHILLHVCGYEELLSRVECDIREKGLEYVFTALNYSSTVFLN